MMLDVLKCKEHSGYTNPYILKQWVQTLVKEIDMVPHGDPQIVHFGDGDLAGWTVIQLITTSNIMAHFNDVDGSAYIDVFSCKPFDSNVVLDHFNKIFEPESIRTTFLTRQA